MQMALLTTLLTGNENDNTVDAGNNKKALLAVTSPTVPLESPPALLPPMSPFESESENAKHDVIEAMSWQITVLGFLASLAIAMNLATCFVHLRFRGRRSNFSSVILAISALDIVFVGGQLGLSIATFAEPKKQADSMLDVGICTAGSMACRLVVLFPIIFVLLEASFLAVGAFNRWLAISKPDVPHWVKGRTCLISMMGLCLFLTIAVGINVVRDDIIMVKDGSRSNNNDYANKLFDTIQSFLVNSNETVISGEEASYSSASVATSFPKIYQNSTTNESSSTTLKGNYLTVSYYTFGCSILPSETSLAIVSGIAVFYFALLTISIGFLIVTWFHIWSLLPLPTSDRRYSLRKMVLRRKPQFVNSKFVDGYKIMWATLLLFIVCSVCALAVNLSPLPASLSSTCLIRRFVASALLFLAALFKCFLYIGFSFTFRRAVFETFVAPCCSRFYRTQNYVVARSSPFDRHMRVAVVAGRDHANNNGFHHHHHHRHHHAARDLFNGEKQPAPITPERIIPSLLLPPSSSSNNGDVDSIFTRHNYNYTAPGFTDPGACFDISDGPELVLRGENGGATTDEKTSSRIAYLSPVKNGSVISQTSTNGSTNNLNNLANSNNAYDDDEAAGGGFTSLANLSATRSPGRSSSGVRRIPVIIDDGHNNDIEMIGNDRKETKGKSHKSHNNNNKNTAESHCNRRDDSDVLASSSVASPQPTTGTMMAEEENKL